MLSLTEKADRINRLTEGFIVPIYSERTENGGQRNMLSEPDFDRVVAGYACSECLAKFTMYLVECPVCGHVRNAARDIEDAAPQMWVDHLKDADAIRRGEKEAPTVRPIGIDAFFKDVSEDPDIEQIKL